MAQINRLFLARIALLLGCAALLRPQAGAQVFVSLTGNNTSILQFSPNGGTPTTFASGLPGAQGLAFDSAGLLYVANSSSHTITKFPTVPTPGDFQTGSVLIPSSGSGLFSPIGLTHRGGFLYVASAGLGTVEKFDIFGNHVTPTFVSSGLNIPYSLVFDNIGNLYVANSGDGSISIVPPNGTPSVFASGLSSLRGITWRAGVLYVATGGNNAILNFTASGNTTGTQLPSTFTGVTDPRDLAFDSSGNLYVCGNHTVIKFDPNGNILWAVDIVDKTPAFIAIQPDCLPVVCPTNKTVSCGTPWTFNTPPGPNAATLPPIVSTVTNGICPQVITRTWLVTDACGNTNTCSQTVTVVDDLPPVLACATNKVVVCGSEWSFDAPAASDSCSGTNVAVTTLSTVTNSFCPLVIQRTWLATDACGNTNTCSQTVTVLDAAPITLSISGSANIFGAGHNTPPNPGGGGTGILPPSYSFSPGPGKVLTFASVTGTASLSTSLSFGSPDGYFLNLPTDINSYGGISGIKHDGASFLVGVFLDSATPGSSAPPRLNFGASGLGPNFTHLAPAIGQTFFIGDGLTDMGVVQQFDVPPGATRLFLGFADAPGYQGDPGQYEDNGGALLAAFQIKEATFICATNKTVECNTAWTFDPPIILSGCSGTNNVSLTVLDTVTKGFCPQLITRTWLGVDACGDTNICSQTVTVIDTVPPVFACSTNKTVQCGSEWSFDTPSATDNCSGTNVLVTILNTVTNNTAIACQVAITRTWLATDACGNTNTCAQVVTVIRNGTGAAQCVPGQVWVPYETNRIWTCIASSGNGNRLIAGALGGNLYTSADSGVTWTPHQVDAGGQNWWGVASSSDGSKLVAVASQGRIYTSTDYGVTWTARDSQRSWFSVTSSTNGVYLAAAVNAGGNSYIYTSSDSGVTWTPRSSAGSQPWYTVASSGDGSKLVAAAYNNYIYTSTDFGATWTQRTSSGARTWYAVASSEDGSKLVALAFGGGIYTSVDGGANWTARPAAGSNRSWHAVASSFDGSKLIAAAFNDRLYVSTDSGVNWVSRESSRNWHGVASSFDGSKLAAVAYGASDNASGRIYVTACPPAIDFVCATDKTVECGAPWSFDPPVLVDDCGGLGITVSVAGTTTNGVCPQIITRTWQASDNCGNTATCSQSVTIISTTPPVIQCPENITVQSCTNVPVDYSVAATSGCCSNVTVVLTPPSGSVFAPGTTNLVRAVATDCCGNTSECNFTVVVSCPANPCPNFVVNGGFETTSPVVNPDTFNNTLDPATGVLGWTTGAGQFFEVWSDNVGFPASEGVNQLEINAQSSDQTVTQVVTGLCTNAPATFCFDYTGRFGLADGTYNNDFTLTLSGGASFAVNLNPAPYAIGGWTNYCTTFIPTSSTVTISFRGHPHLIDAATLGHAGAHIDNVSLVQCCKENPCVPLFTCPTDKTVECGSAWTFDAPIGSSAGVIPRVLTTTTNGVCPEVITRTWLVTDSCGNTNTCTQNVTVVDTTPPVINCPASKSVECGSAWNFDEPSVSDDCGGTKVALTILSTVTNGVSCDEWITRTWLATDACGNISTCSQTVTVVETNKPISEPCQTNSVILNTGFDHTSGAPYSIGTADAFWTVVADPDAGTSEPRPATTITRNPAWIGAQTNSQWISSYSTAANYLNGAYDFETRFCLEPGWSNVVLNLCLAADDSAEAFLNGSPAVLTTPNPAYGTITCATVSDQTLFTAGVNFLRVRVHNTGSVAMGFNLAGTLSGFGLTVAKPECCQPGASVSGQKFNDLNGNGVHDPGEPGLPGWTIQLSPGNYSTVTDTNGNYYFLNLPAGDYAIAEVQQPCWTQTAPASGSYKLTLSAAQSVNNLDFGNRQCQLQCASDKTVDCGSAWSFDPPTVVGGCTGVKVSVLTTVTNDFCPQVIRRTWLVTDACGGTNTCSQTVTVVDKTPPVFDCPSDKKVDCGSKWQFDEPKVSDACCGASVTLTVLRTVTNGICPKVITRTWQAVDCCGNKSTCSQTVTVEDKTPPVFATTLLPVIDQTFEIAHVLEGVGVIDNSVSLAQTFKASMEGTLTDIEVSVSNETTPGKAQPNLVLEVRRTTAEGLPSNERPLATSIIPSSSVSPTPVPLRVSLDNEVPVMPGDVLAIVLRVDSSAGGEAKYGWLRDDGNPYEDGGLYSMSPASALGWTEALPVKTDALFTTFVRPRVCGSVRNVRCGSAWAFYTPQATDACCGTNVTITVLSTTTNGVCPQVITRVWQATDCCGNASTCTQTVRVIDTTPPVFLCPSDKIVRCGSSWSFDTPRVSDVCCGDVKVSVLSTVTNGVCPQVVKRTWQATDCCGNTSTCTQTVTATNKKPILISDLVLLDGAIRFNIDTDVGDTYVVEYKDKLSDMSWTTLQMVTGDGMLKQVVDKLSASGARFYQVRLVNP